jgi:hypothetical protein
MSGGEASRMSVIETRQQALEGKMSQVIATTAANTEALHELKLVFTEYIAKLKDTSDVSPSMSKSAVENDGAALAQPGKHTAPTEVAYSQEGADDVTDALGFDSEDATLPEDNKQPVPLEKSRNCSPPLPAVPDTARTSKDELCAPHGKDVVPRKPELPGAKLKPSAATVKDADGRKGPQEGKPGSGEGDSSAGCMHQAAEKLLEAAKIQEETLPRASTAGPSPKKQKKPAQPSPPKVDAPALDVDEASTQVSSDNIVAPPESPLRVEKSKLLVFNVHGTLLDSSLLQDTNPNSSIRYTMRTPTRRVVCRPWMAELLCRCFAHFEVAFWGNKSTAYMEEVVPAMLRRVNESGNVVPLFVWSQRECEPIEFEGGAPTVWGKPLQRVFDQWPRWNNSNTVILDHKLEMVGCNRGANVIVTRPFYVADLGSLGDDNLHLKASVWPLLEKFFQSKDVPKFRKQYRRDMANAGISVTKLTSSKAEGEVADAVQGEGTYEPRGSYGSLSPCLAFKLISNCGICCL